MDNPSITQLPNPLHYNPNKISILPKPKNPKHCRSHLSSTTDRSITRSSSVWRHLKYLRTSFSGVRTEPYKILAFYENEATLFEL